MLRKVKMFSMSLVILDLVGNDIENVFAKLHIEFEYSDKILAIIGVDPNTIL